MVKRKHSVVVASPSSPVRDRDHMAGLEKGLAVIECFSADRQRLTIAEAARAVGLSRAAARRCLLTLERLGYVSHDGKFFRLTVRTLRLGHAYLASTSLSSILQPYLESLSEELHESCSAAILDGGEIVYIARAAAKRILSVGLTVGTRLPAHCTSLGRVLLGTLAPGALRECLRSTPRVRYLPSTETRITALEKIITQAARDGYAVVDQELEESLISIAVPLFNSAGEVCAAVNISTQAHRHNADQARERFLPHLRNLQKSLRML